ncbi:MAG: hypothetical protein LBE70_02570 [Nitrososphaerota archaeon]|nr:hypothetical protein [Nitrososphaerota archaeon]
MVEFCVAPVTMPANLSPAPEIVSVEIHSNPWVSTSEYSTDPYTGEKQKISTDYTLSRGNISITIKNRSFTPYTDENGNHFNAYYIIWWKIPSDDDFVMWCSRSLYQSDSTYTSYTLSYGVEGILPISEEYRDGGQVMDFRVQAVIGYFNQGIVYEGEGSAFSEFSITIPNSDKADTSTPGISLTSSMPSASNTNQSQSASQQKHSHFDIVIVRVFVALCVLVVLITIFAFLFKQRKTKPAITQT